MSDTSAESPNKELVRRLVDEVMHARRVDLLDVDEVAFLTITDRRITHCWVLEDTATRRPQLAGEDAALRDLGSLS